MTQPAYAKAWRVDDVTFIEVRGENQLWCMRELKRIGGLRPYRPKRRWDAMMIPEDQVTTAKSIVVRVMGVQIHEAG